MATNLSLLDRQDQQLDDYRFEPRIVEHGTVISIGDGVMWIDGLPSAGMEEMLRTDDGSLGLVYMLSENRIGAMILEETPGLRAGIGASLTGRRLTLPTGDELLGRVVDPLGVPLDGGPVPECPDIRLLDRLSPQITERGFVNKPLYTGNKIADTMIPIGHGQRQLLIGDNGTGKTTFALDAVLHQAGRDVCCVYVLIGQKRSTVAQVIETLRTSGALAYTTVVVAEASARPGLKYLAPFAGCAIAEHWMETGRRTLIVYDDLSTHAQIYRELSLLLRRPPGREAYPGDVFYLHARLLERSTCLSAEKGGGSMTALAVVETQQDEIAAYIPTNLISITDGQVYFDHKLFASGILPAIDVPRSVSRIGGQAQHPAIKRESARMKLDYLQFLELEVFSHFGSKLEAGIQARLTKGRLLRQILKQDAQSPLSPKAQLAWTVAFNEKFLDGRDQDAVNAAISALSVAADTSSLTLDSPREDWVTQIRRWLP
ncbi:MAG TPA: F0F1 ATP synthase subunit alpha [Alphaproteobacteria bacterium]|nr:F0F1 ATP synthase subunit alpha [Alphaproteobacteria bacterium]